MNVHNFIKERLCVRSIESSFKRLSTLFSRYGFTSDKFVYSLHHFTKLAHQYGIVLTLPVTASVVNRHSRIFQRLQDQGVELAVHGSYHIDYTQLNINEVRHHLYQAAAIFNRHGIRYSGFRFPFLRKDNERIQLLNETGFLWDSSEVISWNSLDPNLFHNKNWADYQKIIKTYNAVDADQTESLPYIQNGLVEIPISVPDDDIIIERLGIKDEQLIYSIWEKILCSVRERGELFVLQVHPERYCLYQHALKRILQLAGRWGDVWITSLKEIAKWWQEKEDFRLVVKRGMNNRYHIIPECTDRATLIVENAGSNHHHNETIVLKKEKCEIESQRKPIIGIDPDASSDVIDILRREGYPYEISIAHQDYSHFIKQKGKLNPIKKKSLLQSIHDNPFPLIRFWRWPNQFRYSFAITGDIDGVNLWDYGERFYG